MQDRTIPLTFSRVIEALAALRRDFRRLITQADRRIAGPPLTDAIPVWIEGLIAEVLHVKGIDLEKLQADIVPASQPAKARRQPPAQPGPAFSRMRHTVVEAASVPDWLTEGIPGAKAYVMKPGNCGIVVGRHERHGWHLHVAHTRRLPTWVELHDAQRLLIPPTVMMAMMLYPVGWGITYPQNRLSLYEVKPRDISDLARKMAKVGGEGDD
jgi:hypothetical protein